MVKFLGLNSTMVRLKQYQETGKTMKMKCLNSTMVRLSRQVGIASLRFAETVRSKL